MISGYFLSKTNTRDIIKPVRLLVQVIMFNELLYIAEVIINDGDLDLRKIISRLFPASYFAILYVALYLISPLINNALTQYKNKRLTQVGILLMALFSVEPFFVDIIKLITGSEMAGLSFIGIGGSDDGYTIVNFILMYIIGTWIRVLKVDKAFSSKCLLGGLMIIAGIIAYTSYRIGDLALSYCNPLVISEAVLVILLFLKMQFYMPVINKLAKATFSVYLLNIPMVKMLNVKWIVGMNLFIMLCTLLIVAAGIYLICWAIDAAYNRIVNIVFKSMKPVNLDFLA